MFEFFAGIKHFQKHKQHTSKDAEFIALHDQGQFCNQIQMLQYIKRQDSATVCTRTNCTNKKLHKCLNSLLQLNIFKNTNNTHQKMQNSSLYTITPLLQPDSNATIHQTTRFSNCMQVTNKLHKCLNFLLELNIFKNTNNTHQIMQQFIALHDSARRHEQT